ncbi:MAG: globin [Pseudomonadales bacterium]|nr:globin [Pseudomonadales bacterium]
MGDFALIVGSLERLAESEVDITPQVYAHFFARCPEAAALFGSREAQAVQGKMVNELVQTVVDRLEAKPYSATLVATMVSDHRNWGATLPMYDVFLEAFVEALSAVPSVVIESDALDAWRRQLAGLRQDIAAQLAAP